MLTTALSLPASQDYCVTMASISGIYSKRAYSSKQSYQPCGFPANLGLFFVDLRFYLRVACFLQISVLRIAFFV